MIELMHGEKIFYRKFLNFPPFYSVFIGYSLMYTKLFSLTVDTVLPCKVIDTYQPLYFEILKRRLVLTAPITNLLHTMS